uniref:(California timema) hypothetical protein n=1 Tax=Timema californicum TaxID=61474 RepID=A0A7R9P5W5_TIMCA|nr:unnamed protein product [Timema californicum]
MVKACDENGGCLRKLYRTKRMVEDHGQDGWNSLERAMTGTEEVVPNNLRKRPVLVVAIARHQIEMMSDDTSTHDLVLRLLLPSHVICSRLHVTEPLTSF